MNSRKEMIPAPIRELHKSPGFCGPEWDLLCRVRKQIKTLLDTKYAVSQQARGTIRKKLKGIIAGMDDVFDDWPEDPK